MFKKTSLFIAVALFCGGVFAQPQPNANIQPAKVKLNSGCANPTMRMKTLTAVNDVDCEASVDPNFGEYFVIMNVYKNGQTITPRASCRALAQGDRVKLVLKQSVQNKKAYDVYVCN